MVRTVSRPLMFASTVEIYWTRCTDCSNSGSESFALLLQPLSLDDDQKTNFTAFEVQIQFGLNSHLSSQPLPSVFLNLFWVLLNQANFDINQISYLIRSPDSGPVHQANLSALKSKSLVDHQWWLREWSTRQTLQCKEEPHNLSSSK